MQADVEHLTCKQKRQNATTARQVGMIIDSSSHAQLCLDNIEHAGASACMFTGLTVPIPAPPRSIKCALLQGV